MPRPVRRGFAGEPTTGGPDKLAITAPPPASFSSGVEGGSTTVRLVTAAGDPILRAGVTVTLRTTPSIPLSPASAVTDATGAATFTDLTLTGPVGTYRLLFNAVGYDFAESLGHALLAGPFSAAGTTADVPTGLEDHATTVTIQLRDASGNAITTNPGGVALTVQVSGTNTVAETAATYTSLGRWTFSYTPANDGTDTLTIKLNGTGIGGSPFTSIVDPYVVPTDDFTPGQSLRVGMSGMDDPFWGSGPYVSGGTWPVPAPTGHPRWRATMVILPANSTDLSNLIDLADQYDITVYHYIAGSPGNYGGDTSGGYSESLWRARVDRFLDTDHGGVLTVAAALKFKLALKRRRVILYGPDEPWHLNHWHGSFWPYFVKRQFQYLKDANHWPDSLICARLEPQYLHGWTISACAASGYPNDPPYQNTVNLQPDGIKSVALPLVSPTWPQGYFDKLDYTFATYVGQYAAGTTPMSWFTAGYNTNRDYGMGTVFATNWVDLRDAECGVFADDPNNDVPGTNINVKIQGHLAPSVPPNSGGVEGKALPCSQSTVVQRWLTTPDRFKSLAAAAAHTNFADVPAFLPWIHPGSDMMEARIKAWAKCAEFVAAHETAIRSGNARSSTFAWRTPK